VRLWVRFWRPLAAQAGADGREYRLVWRAAFANFKEHVMYQRIFVPVDDSSTSRRALR